MNPEVRLILHKKAVEDLDSDASIIEIQENQKLFIDWFESLPENIKVMVVELLQRDIVELNAYEIIAARVDMWLNLNDTFGYACADGEGIEIEEIPIFHKTFIKHGWDGVIAWASKKRNAMPLEIFITAEFKKSLEELNNGQD